MTIDQRIPTKTPGGKPIEVESRSRPGLKHFVNAEMDHCSCEDHQINGNTCFHLLYARALKKATQGLRTQRAKEEVANTLLETLRAAYAPVRAKENPMDSYRFACSVPFGPEIRRAAFARHAKVLAMAERRASTRGAG